MAQCNCPFFAPAARWTGTRPSHFQNKEDNHNRNANYCIQLKNIRAKFFYQRHKLRHAILHRAVSFLTLPSLWKNHIIARAGRQGPVVLSLLKENALESTFLTGFAKRKAKNKKPGKAHNNRLFEAFCLVRPTGFEPAAFRVGAERSIHLSYGRKYRCLFRRARGRGISFRLLCRRTLYPPAEGKNLLAKVHPSYGRKYRCLFGRAGRECRFCYLW